jgi:hypothetical protein
LKLCIFLLIFKEPYLDEWREHKQFDGDRMKWGIYIRSGFVDEGSVAPSFVTQGRNQHPSTRGRWLRQPGIESGI